MLCRIAGVVEDPLELACASVTSMIQLADINEDWSPCWCFDQCSCDGIGRKLEKFGLHLAPCIHRAQDLQLFQWWGRRKEHLTTIRPAATVGYRLVSVFCMQPLRSDNCANHHPCEIQRYFFGIPTCSEEVQFQLPGSHSAVYVLTQRLRVVHVLPELNVFQHHSPMLRLNNPIVTAPVFLHCSDMSEMSK